MTSAFAAVLPAVLLAVTSAPAAPPLATERERLSYAIGADLGWRLKALAPDADPAVVAAGLRDALAGATPALTKDEIATALATMQAQVKTRQAAALAARNGRAFLATNRAREDVVTLPSGLQYRILAAGSGRRPAEDQTLEYHYRAALVDGTEVDSSRRHGHPATLGVEGGAVAGVAAALRLMDVGARWQVVVPPELAHGAQGAGVVGPEATLVYDLELLATH